MADPLPIVLCNSGNIEIPSPACTSINALDRTIGSLSCSVAVFYRVSRLVHREYCGDSRASTSLLGVRPFRAPRLKNTPDLRTSRGWQHVADSHYPPTLSDALQDEGRPHLARGIGRRGFIAAIHNGSIFA